MRARYMDPGTGRFISRDTWGGDYNSPMSLNRWMCVEGIPVNFIDPSGWWRWRLTSSIYHLTIENFYEGTPFNPSKHSEYTIPSFWTRPDIFNSVTGALFEIEPWFLANSTSHGVSQAMKYVVQMNMASDTNLLEGKYFGIPYNWNETTFRLGLNSDWPGKYDKALYLTSPIDLVANYAEPGLVLYWLEPNALGLALLAAGAPLIVPNKRLVKTPGWKPGKASQPIYATSYSEACGKIIIVVGGLIMVVNIVENFATAGVGTLDDVVVVGSGLYFIDVGKKMAYPIDIVEDGNGEE